MPGSSPAQAAPKISFPQLLRFYVTVERSLETFILCPPHGEGSWSGLLHASCSLSLSPPFPNYFILHEALSQADYFKNYCLRGSALRLQSFPLHQTNQLCLKHLECNHFTFRGLFLIIHLYSAQFNRTLILAGAFQNPCIVMQAIATTFTYKNHQHKRATLCESAWGRQTVRSIKWLLRHACNLTELICSFRLQTTNSHFSQPQKK